MFKKFVKKNLEAANQFGTEGQQIDMNFSAAILAQQVGELSDFMGGVRRLNDHAHHKPKDLADAIIERVLVITQIRKEIGR